MKISQRVSSYLAYMIFSLTFTKERNSVKTIGGVTVLIFSNCIMILYICGKFLENILKVLNGTIFTLKFTNGHYFVKNVDGVTELFFCISSDHDYTCTKLHFRIHFYMSHQRFYDPQPQSHQIFFQIPPDR